MSYRCCKCKAVADIEHGHYVTGEPCIYCGHNEYFWFDYIEHKLGKSRPKVRCPLPQK